jgi:hypothetical protein
MKKSEGRKSRETVPLIRFEQKFQTVPFYFYHTFTHQILSLRIRRKNSSIFSCVRFENFCFFLVGSGATELA